MSKNRRGMTTDVRIGKHFLYAGVGYGGSCFPKDVQALMATAPQEQTFPWGSSPPPKRPTAPEAASRAKVKAHFGPNLAGKTFGSLGARVQAQHRRHARGSGAHDYRRASTRRAPKIRAFDPVQPKTTAKKQPAAGACICANAYEALKGADALLIVTEWNEFRHPDFDRIKSLLKAPFIFDGRNLYNPAQMRAMGFTYLGIGRK